LASYGKVKLYATYGTPHVRSSCNGSGQTHAHPVTQAAYGSWHQAVAAHFVYANRLVLSSKVKLERIAAERCRAGHASKEAG